ncbi:MAG: DUF342 domain-containing protein [Spirochaetales bacterium]|jgi:uncharacterized protein|nr:DUF342 domain-containing protein [Spirochaetales bacterium]
MKVLKKLLQTKDPKQGKKAVSAKTNLSADTESQTAPVEDKGEAASSSGSQSIGRQNWRVTISPDKLTVFLDYAPKADIVPPVPEEIFNAVRELGGPEDGLFDADTLGRALGNADTSDIPLRQYAISEDLEGGFEIIISEDKLRASLKIQKGRGRGAALDLKLVGAGIKSSGIKKLNLEQLKEDILTFYRGPELVLEDYELARGAAPVAGANREFTLEVEFLKDSDFDELKKRISEVPTVFADEVKSLEEYPLEMVQDAALVKQNHILAALSPLDKGTPGTDVFGQTIAGLPGNDIRLEFHENIEVRKEGLVGLVDGILERWEIEGVPHLRLRPHADSEVIAKIEPDNMSATVDLIQGTGSGTRLSTEGIRQALIAAEVIRGIDLEAVEEALKMAEADGSVGPVIVARGESPSHQDEEPLKFHVDFASGKAVTIRKNGRADYRNQDRFTSVEAGVLIAEIVTPDTQQEDGWDVRGNPIQVGDAKAFALEISKNIRQETDEQGRLKLYSAVAGELLYDGNSLDIAAVHAVKGDIGPATGNVKFDGPVNITGSVLPGFFVIASGDIKIAEGIEAALVSSEKAIHVNAGIKGGGKAAIRARKNVTAAFAEQVAIMSVEDITVKNACMQCTIKCNGRLSLETEKGYLIGGTTKARGGVNAANIGSKNGAKTAISFGQDYLIGDKIELEEKELEKLKTAAVKTDALIREAEKSQDLGALQKHRAKKVQILKLNERRTERLFWLREKFEQHFDSEIAVRGIAYPGVVLESHGRTYDLTVEKRKVVFVFNQEKGIIEEKALTAAAGSRTDEEEA